MWTLQVYEGGLGTSSHNSTARSSIGLLLLAAGSASRLGAPKQLLQYMGQSLLRRAASTALATECRPVVVVLGAHAELLKAELRGLPVSALVNTEWAAGMSGSIRVGMAQLTGVDPPNAVLIWVCDQPLVVAQDLQQLVLRHGATNAPVVAAEYGGSLGVPALFDSSLFPDLLALTGLEGAKRVIRSNIGLSEAVCLPHAAVDIDTAADYTRLTATDGVPGG